MIPARTSLQSTMDPTRENPSPLQTRLFRTVLILGILTMVALAIMPLIGTPGMAGEKSGFGLGRWIAFFGGFHPIFLHLPIGGLTVVVAMEFAALVSLGRYRAGTTLALLVAAAAGVVAAVLGYCLYLEGEFSGELIQAHKRDAIIFSLLLILTFMVKYAADVMPLKRFLRPVYLVSLLATMVMMVRAGHFGGEITHGDPLDKAPWKKVEEPVPAKPDPVVFESIIMPILEAKCGKCHGEEKQKSELRMDSYAAIVAGGELQADGDGKVLVPGSATESTMISFLSLPLDDDLRMPPEGKTQLTEEEIQILTWWVETGASETATLSQLELTPEVSAALEAPE